MGLRLTNVPTRCFPRRRDCKPGSQKWTSQPAFSRIGDPPAVEKIDDDGGIEVTIFGGPNAGQQAIQYVDWR
jgi:hypothetical protein